MLRVAFIMQVDPKRHQEYTERHNPIWPELEQTLKDHGVHTYSIFLDAETSQLFAYAEVEDRERWEGIAKTEVCQRWWKHMSDIMTANPDGSPTAKTLSEVFHIE